MGAVHGWSTDIVAFCFLQVPRVGMGVFSVPHDDLQHLPYRGLKKGIMWAWAVGHSDKR